MSEPTDEVTVFDPTALREKVTSVIRSSFADLIPDDAWDDLVRKEIDLFFKGRVTDDYGKNKYHPSPFRVMVEEVMAEILRPQLKEELLGPKYQGEWDGQEYAFGTEVTKALMDHIPQLMHAVLGGFVNNAMQAMRRSLQEDGQF